MQRLQKMRVERTCVIGWHDALEGGFVALETCIESDVTHTEDLLLEEGRGAVPFLAALWIIEETRTRELVCDPIGVFGGVVLVAPDETASKGNLTARKMT